MHQHSSPFSPGMLSQPDRDEQIRNKELLMRESHMLTERALLLVNASSADLLLRLSDFPMDRRQSMIEDIQMECASRYAPESRTAFDLLEMQPNRLNRYLSSGCAGLDALLRGGFLAGHVTEIVGPSGSGKTQLCMHTCARSTLYEEFCRTFYIDSNSSFSAGRIATFIEGFLHPYLEQESTCTSEGQIDKFLSRMCVYRAFDPWELQQTLDFIERELLHLIETGTNLADKSTEVKARYPPLIVIDSLCGIFSGELSKHRTGWELLDATSKRLKLIAQRYHAAILVCNSTFGSFRSLESSSDASVSNSISSLVVRASLGETWASVPHTQLIVARCKPTETDKGEFPNSENCLFTQISLGHVPVLITELGSEIRTVFQKNGVD